MSYRNSTADHNLVSRPKLEPVELVPSRGIRAVPEKPTMEMLTAGSLAGGVSVETAWNVWQAMLKAAPRDR